MCEGMLHIRDVEGSKKTGSVETRLEAMEQQVFKCQGMVERGLNANHMMIMVFTNKHMIDANDIGKHLSRLYDRIDQLQAQIYDLQNQNFSLPGSAISILLVPLQEKVTDLGLELINLVIEPGEVLPNVIGINRVLVGELRDHHVVGVESIASSLVSMLSVFLGPSTSRMCNIPSRISID
ncbi:40S ribosomal protein S5-1 [Hordeum vulgare]|nr:40S ribosomal protein S5-1 [Hordeum vulgare]